MTRRGLLALASAGVLRAQAPPALKFRGLDHIEFTVTDVERSVAFYAQLFGGAEVMKNRTTTRRYIRLGASYMAIDRADAPRIDHVCLGIENFDIAEVHAFLTARGLTYRDYPSGRDTGVNDPDGTRLQLASVDGWTSLAAQTASPEPRSATAVVGPINLAFVQVGVNNFSSSMAHYGKIFGASLGSSFGNIGLVTGVPGYRRFSVGAAAFDVAEVSRKLEVLGARVEPPEGPRSITFIDPDGFRVEIVQVIRIEE